MKWWMLGIWLSPLLAVPAHAIGISSMLQYADEKGEVEFVITNSEDYRQYVNVLLSELVVERGQITKIPYTRANVNKWAMESFPARSILEPGFKKVFSLIYRPIAGEPVVNRDRVFQASFIPAPYFAEGEKKSSAVKMAFGFAPMVIIPAKEPQPITYDIRYRGDKVSVTNKGNSFFTLYLDGCAKETEDRLRNACSSSTTVLAGRELDIPLSAVMAKQSILRAQMTSHGNKHKAEATLRKQS